MADHLVRGIFPAANLRVAAAVTTGLSAHAARIHQCEPTSAVAFGRALTSALLAAAELLKGNDALNLNWVGNGPISSLFVDADGEGNVRGYVRSPFVKAQEDGAGPRPVRPSIGGVFGDDGLLQVVRDLEGGTLWRGTVSLATGEVDDDVARYLTESEQLPAAVGADVVLSHTGDVLAAGGVIVTTLPGAAPGAVEPFVERLLKAPLAEHLAAQLATGSPPRARALLTHLFGDGRLDVLDDRLVQYRCRCSRARAESAMGVLTLDDLEAFVEAGEPARVACDFCATSYEFDLDALATLIARRTATAVTAQS